LKPPALLDTLHDPAVRDLAWVIGSPVLLDPSYPAYHGQVLDDAWCSRQLQQSESWLSKLDLSPTSLHQFIETRPTRRLGLYFETLIKFWLLHRTDAEIIATNLQVHDTKRTLGEFDFLIRDKLDGVCHWEVAIKFYLQTETRPEQRAFIGPDTQDRLDLKLDRVFQHQLVLAQTPAGLEALPPSVKIDKTLAFIKGYLFYHATFSAACDVQGVSDTHLSGWWIRHCVDELPQRAQDSRWLVLPRMRWLSPVRLPTTHEVLTQAALHSLLTTHFAQYQEALLIAELQRNVDGWQEVSRGFVVCKSWPQLEV
jgi:uncharacterized protein